MLECALLCVHQKLQFFCWWVENSEYQPFDLNLPIFKEESELILSVSTVIPLI